MTRMTFKPEFVDAILRGEKRHSSRWSPIKGVKEGQTVAAVTNKGKSPAFLTPAKDAFAHLRIVPVTTMFWKDFTEEHAAKCGVTRQWYMDKNPTASEFSTICLYGFEVASDGE